jgi:hypothetical protein
MKPFDEAPRRIGWSEIEFSPRLSPELMKRIVFTFVWMIAFFTVGFGIYAQGTSTNGDIASTPAFKTFIQSYVAAVNSKDRTKFIALVHPKSVQLLAADKALSEYVFSNTFLPTFPTNYSINVAPIPADEPLLYSDAYSFPVRPTLEFAIQGGTPPHEGFDVGTAIFEDGKWKVVIPAIDEKKLEKENPQSAIFIGKVISIERSEMDMSGFGIHVPTPLPWKAVVKVESVERLWLWAPATKVADEVSIYYDQQDLLNTNRSYEFTCFGWHREGTNRVATTLFGGKVIPQ